MPAKVAIVTRTKNRPLLLQRCLLSVLNQTYGDWLHVIVNDGGEALAVEGAVARLADRYRGRVKILHNETSLGMEAASNIALKATESEYVTIHDDDDSWQPLFLEECVAYLDAEGPESVEQGVVVQTVRVLEEMDAWGNVIEHDRHNFTHFESVGLFQMASRNMFPPIALLYRRRVHETIGYFDATLNVLGDYDFNLRFLSRYEMGTINKRLANYHWRQQAGGNSYGNTVVDSVAAHRKTLAKLQNRYLREDLAKGRVGLGLVVNVAQDLSEHTARLEELNARCIDLKRIFVKTTKRLEHYDRFAQSWLKPWKAPGRFIKWTAVWFKGGAGGQYPAAKNGHVSRATLESSLQRAKVVSLDVFDTALMRLVRRPADVFLYMQPEVRRLLNRPNLGFVDARMAAEEESREELRRARQSGETTLEGIYRVLGMRLRCDEETAKQITELELQTERRLSFANPEMTRLAAWAGENGRQLVFSSDMYLPPGEITGLLAQNGFKDARLFLSAELRASKHEGGLFDHVIEYAKCQPVELLHIGDNEIADVERPRARGIGAHHWTRTAGQVPLVDQQASLSGAWNGDLASSLYTGLVRRRRLSHPVDGAEGRAFWEMIGYEVAGPLYHAFVSWVMERAARRKLRKLFFLARDGFHLVKVFEMVREKSGLEMEAAYLFASRRLFNVARIERLDDEVLGFLVRGHPQMRVGDFLARIGIDPAPHEALARRFGFAGTQERVTTKYIGGFTSGAHQENMRRLLREFEGPILEMARRERGALTEYFKDIGLAADGAGIVDIGWNASASRAVPALLAQAGQARNIPGFYFGTWAAARKVVEGGAEIESFFMHLDEPVQHARILIESVELLESLFSAPHPTITGLAKKNGRWEALYGDPDMDGPTTAALEIVTAAAFEFVRDAQAVWPKEQETAPAIGYLEATLERLAKHPRKDEATVLGNLSWRESFSGPIPMSRLAKPPSTWQRMWKPQLLQEGYDFCYWKQGFLAQLSQQERKRVKV